MPACGESVAVPLLTLPDVRQTAGHDCGEAAAKCVLEVYQVVAKPKFATPIDGSDPRTLESWFRRLGFHVLSGEMTLDILKAICQQMRPVICLITPEGSDSHYVTVKRVSRRGVYFQCPWDGPSSMSEADWLESWTAVDRCGTRYSRWALACWPP